MRLIIMLFGILYIIIGMLFVVFTESTKEVLRNLLKGKKVQSLSIISLAVGMLFIMGSRVVDAPWVLVLFGLLGIAKGAFFMFAPEKKTKPFIDWWLNASMGIHKCWGIVAFLMGILLLLIL